MSKLLLLIPVIALCACGPLDKCRVDDTRCSGANAQVCASDQTWQTFMNCNEVTDYSGGQWTCQALEADGGHTCLPAEGLPEDGGVL